MPVIELCLSAERERKRENEEQGKQTQISFVQQATPPVVRLIDFSGKAPLWEGAGSATVNIGRGARGRLQCASRLERFRGKPGQ